MENLVFCEVLSIGVGLTLKQKIEALKDSKAEFYNKCFVKIQKDGLMLISTNYKDRVFVDFKNVLFWRILATNLSQMHELKNKAS